MNSLPQDSDHIYYNVSIRKTDEFKNLPFKAEFSENRVSPILMNPSDYELAVTRFSIPTQNIPIFLWPSDTTFKVSIKYLTNVFTVNLLFIPNSPGGNYDYYSRSVWSYQDFIDSINIGLNTAFNQFVAGTPSFSGKPTTPPYMIYEATAELCSLVASIDYDTTILNPVYIFFNEALGSYFPGIQNFTNNDPILTKWIRVKDNFNNKITIAGNDFYKITEEYQSLFLWNSLQSIVITSDTIPLVNELIGAQTNKQQKIITDFEPLSSINDRSVLQYFPQGPLRFYNLVSNFPLSNVNVNIFWRDKNEKLYPLYLNDTDVLTIKIYFKRKGILVDY